MNKINRKTFLKQASLLGLGGFTSSILSAWLPLPVLYGKRWVWMHPPHKRSEDDWLERFRNLKSKGIKSVLLMVYDSHKAFYNNPLLPVEQDILQRVLPLASQVGIEIHAWMWTLPNNNPDYAQHHPDWFVVNREGKPAHSHPAYVSYYKFMCPNHPEVREFLRQHVTFLASIEGLAGVHLDYIRMPDVILAEALQPKYNIVQDKEYPQYDYCYCNHCRRLFSELTGKDPISDLSDPFADAQWRQFRFDSVTSLVNEVLAPAIEAKGKYSSAAVFPNYESVRQQWMRWNLNAFFPMLYHNFYNAQPGWIAEQVRKFKNQIPLSKKIYAGVFVPALTPQELVEVEKLSLDAGAEGISFFDYNAMIELYG